MPVTLPILLLTISLPKPSIIWHPAPDAIGKHYFQCSAQEKYAGSWFYLYKGSSEKPLAQKKALPKQPNVTFEVYGVGPSEQFCCSYEIWESGKVIRSPQSSLANNTAAHYPKPSIAARPGTDISEGQDWTLRCWAPFAGVSFVFYQARDFRFEVTPQGGSNVAEFSLKKVTEADGGRYTCYYHSTTEPVTWSNASDPVLLNIIGVAETTRYQEVLVDSAGKYRVNCSVPSTAGGWFYLYDDGKPLAESRAWRNGTVASFGLTEEALSSLSGQLSCQFGETHFNDTRVQTQDSSQPSSTLTVATNWRLGLGVPVLLVALLFVADAVWAERHQEN